MNTLLPIRISMFAVVISCALPGWAIESLPAPAPLTGATLRTLQGEQKDLSNLRRNDFLRAAHMPAHLVQSSDPAGIVEWLKAAREAGFNTVIVPVIAGGTLLLDPVASISARKAPGMVRQDAQGQASGLLPLVLEQAALHTPSLQVWASLEIGSLDVGSPDALSPRHPARTQPKMLKEASIRTMGGTLAYDLSNQNYLELISLVAAEVAGTQGVSGVVIGDLQPHLHSTLVLTQAIRQTASAIQKISPQTRISLQTDGGSLPWSDRAPLSTLAREMGTGTIQHWIHRAAADETGEAPALQAAVHCPVPLTIEVSLHPGMPLTVPAAQSLQAVTDNRFAGLSVRSDSMNGLQVSDLKAFRSILDADSVESRLSSMARRIGGTAEPLRATPEATVGTAAMLPLPASSLPPSQFAAPDSPDSAPGLSPLPAMDSGSPEPAQPAQPAPPASDSSSTPDSLSLAVSLAVENVPVATAPPVPNTPASIRVPNRPSARYPSRWDGVRATRYATSEDISAFQDSPTRQQRPSSSIEFIHIDHSDNESPLAPPNRSREMLDFASMSRSEATTRRGPAVSDAPVLQLTTTTGRSFTGRAVLQGTLWRVELDSGAVVSLPADRVVSSQPLGSN